MILEIKKVSLACTIFWTVTVRIQMSIFYFTASSATLTESRALGRIFDWTNVCHTVLGLCDVEIFNVLLYFFLFISLFL